MSEVHESVEISNVSPELRRAWHPVAASGDVGDTPLRVELLGDAWVLVRIAGELRAFVDQCPHRAARLSDGCVIDDTLQCPYHGWRFDGNGQCRLVPALGPDAAVPAVGLTAPAAITERYGLVWIAPDEPVCDLLPVAELDDDGLDAVWIPPVDVPAGAAQILDNFLDFAHFPFVHAGTFGSEADELVGKYSTESVADGWGFVVDHDHTIENHEDPLVESGEHPLVQPRTMRYEYRVPFSANLRLELPLAGMVNAIVLWCQPLDRDRTRVYMVMARNDCPTPESRREAIDYELRIFAEDRRILERLPSTTLALDGQAHTRADRHTVVYRRILKQLFN